MSGSREKRPGQWNVRIARAGAGKPDVSPGRPEIMGDE